MNANIKIESINKDDLYKDSKFMEYIGRDALPIYYNSSEIMLMAMSRKEKHLIYKILLNNVMIGYSIIEKFIDDNRLHIMSIGVLKKYRGKGYGSTLITKIKEIIDNSDNYNKISLYVKVDNEAAVNFYKKNEFVIDKTIKNYYNRFKNNDAYYLIYQKKL